MKKHLFASALFMIITHAATASTIGDIGDFISFKVLPVYSFGATVYNSDWETWYDYDWRGLRDLVAANLVKTAVTDGLKDRVHEMRPNKMGLDSFPSGHTANAFTNAAFVHRRYGINQAIIPYALAGFVGFSRVESRWHYTHDVLAGAAIGFLSGWFFADKKVQVGVSADTNGASVQIHTTF